MMTLKLQKFNPIEKLERKQIMTIVLLLLLGVTIFAVSLGDSNAPQGIFAEGGIKTDFMDKIKTGIEWLITIAIVIVSLILFFSKGSRDLNLSEIITHLIVTVIVAWLANNFVKIITKAAGAEVDTNTKQVVSVTDNVNNVPEDIVEYVTPLGIVRQ